MWPLTFVTNWTTGRLGKAFTCIYTLSLPQRLRLTVGWEEGGRGELVTGQLAVWTLHAEVETLKGRSGPRRRTETLTLVWAVPRLVRHCCLGLTCSLGPWLSCKWGYVRNCSQSLSGSLNDMYNLSAKTGSVNKEVKPFPVTFVKCGAFRIRNCC